ncbi:MAG: hypothetical protein HY075_14795 [Deltaproteobacteria bacterium]|nr:hypothetical protein [Deltaproteobacteria bacterium]
MKTFLFVFLSVAVSVSVSVPTAVSAREIFVIAGQSNSANHGNAKLVPTDRRVFSFDYSNGSWRPAYDPQPTATGNGGSPWPAFGSRLARRLGTGVGIVSIGVGGSAAAEWLPDGGHFWRFQAALKALGPNAHVRAILWHQGEADVYGRTTTAEYVKTMAALIDAVNAEAGYRIPWLVAQATYVNFEKMGEHERARMAEIQLAQQLLWSSGKALRGANTDDLIGPEWRWDGIHFNKRGLTLHGQRWADAVATQLYPGRRGD